MGGVAPFGAARGGSLLLLGHLPIPGLFLPTSLSAIPALRLAVQRQPCHSRHRRPNTEADEGKGRRTQKNFPLHSTESSGTKQTAKETVQIRSGLKGNNEGDDQINRRCKELWEGYKGRSDRLVLIANWSALTDRPHESYISRLCVTQRQNEHQDRRWHPFDSARDHTAHHNSDIMNTPGKVTGTITRSLQPTCYPDDCSTANEDGELLDGSSR